MFVAQNRRTLLLFVLLILTVGSIAISIAFNILRHDHQQIHEPLHSTLEAFGGMAAIAMAMLLLQLHRDGQREKGEYYLLSMGFFMMGILDTTHAVSSFGYGFILLRSLAGLCGGCWFALVCFPRVGQAIGNNKAIPWLLVAATVITGLLILNYREFFPLMVKDEKLTPAALVISLLSGILTLTSACYFFREFWRSSRTESYFFTCMLLFLSLSSLEFPMCVVWSRDWWFWHVQRCLAYTVVFYYMLRVFLSVSDQLKKTNMQLEQRVAERTAELTREVAERMRYGRERDQVITELQEAMTRIKVLTGLLPTCASCKKIRDAEGKWVQMEAYIQNHSEARFTHGICPTCARALYPEVFNKMDKAS